MLVMKKHNNLTIHIFRVSFTTLLSSVRYKRAIIPLTCLLPVEITVFRQECQIPEMGRSARYPKCRNLR